MLIAAGGTAGHVVPAVAVADELRRRGHVVSFAASRGRRDEQLIRDAGYDVELFDIGGLPRRVGVAQVVAIVRAVRAVMTALGIVRRTTPDIVLAGGGFVSTPVALAARMRGVPVVTTEADAHLGLANRMSAAVSQRLCTAYALDRYRTRQDVTGRPVTRAFAERYAAGARARVAARQTLGYAQDARVVVVFGGSGGATRLNEAAWAAWGSDTDPRIGEDPLHILHITGARDYAGMRDHEPASARYRLEEYRTDMPDVLAAADLVVCRPGGSVFELAACGTPAILVPSPWVTADHQRANARHFVDLGAAVMAEDDAFDGTRMRAMVDTLLSSDADAQRADMARAMRSMARPDAAARIASIVEQCGNAHARRDATDSDSAPTEPLRGRRFHMLGIGGAGVSALARLCSAWGARVDGCDPTRGPWSEQVERDAIVVHAGHDAAHVAPGMTVVASSAVPADHPELVRARELGCEVVLRGQLLGELTRLRPDTIVVAGAHGKSTTTGMLAHMCMALGLDPAVASGAAVSGLGPEPTNVRAGRGPFLVEGDESDRTLLELTPRVAVVTNIERDHHHTFSSDAEVEALFADWIRRQRPAVLVAGPGDELDRLVAAAPDGVRVVRYGLDAAEVRGVSRQLAVSGQHNALNALGAITALVELTGVDRRDALRALRTFRGVGRRFDEVGEARGVLVVDDYAHHPTEVAATIAAARERAVARGGRVLVAFQPHLYSRTQALAEAFAAALAGADRVWVLPIYGAREVPVAGVTSELITSELERIAPWVFAGAGPGDPATGAVTTMLDELMEHDLVITMGAGSVTELAPRIVEALGGEQLQVDDTLSWLERDVSLARMTTIGSGGAARWFARVESEHDLQRALDWAHAQSVPVAVVGLGSNSLVDDAGFEGLALRLAGELARIDIAADDGRVVLGGGASLAAAVRRCRDAGLSGFEFACAIPGTAGGALKMNAGCYGGQMRDVVIRARIVDSAGVRDVAVDDLELSYRHSNIPWGTVVSDVTLHLTHDDPDAIKARVRQMQARRSESQPRAARSFGSVFQNPRLADQPDANDDAIVDGTLLGAGALIERAGLKGHRIGGACISPKHGNFIENDEGATTTDILQLIELARTTVRERFGVSLATEVHVLGPTGYRWLHEPRGEA